MWVRRVPFGKAGTNDSEAQVGVHDGPVSPSASCSVSARATDGLLKHCYCPAETMPVTPRNQSCRTLRLLRANKSPTFQQGQCVEAVLLDELNSRRANLQLAANQSSNAHQTCSQQAESTRLWNDGVDVGVATGDCRRAVEEAFTRIGS